MSFLQIIFYVFSIAAVVSGMMVVSAKNPVQGVLFLIMTFVSMAGVWMILNAEFLALILVLVYVGAVMTLFLFVVMMLNIKVANVREGFVRYLPLGLMVVLLLVGLIAMVVSPAHFGLSSIPAPAALPADYSNLADLASVLYTNYAYPFEIAAVLLLTSIVAAIALTHHKKKKHRVQDIEKQIAVKREDRVRLVDMELGKRRERK